MGSCWMGSVTGFAFSLQVYGGRSIRRATFPVMPWTRRKFPALEKILGSPKKLDRGVWRLIAGGRCEGYEAGMGGDHLPCAAG